MVTKPKAPRGRPKKTAKPKEEEVTASEALTPEDAVLQNVKPQEEEEGSPVEEISPSVRLAHVELLLSKQADDMTVLSKERDELKAKVASLSLKVSALLRDKEQLQLELNVARKNEK